MLVFQHKTSFSPRVLPFLIWLLVQETGDTSKGATAREKNVCAHFRGVKTEQQILTENTKVRGTTGGFKGKVHLSQVLGLNLLIGCVLSLLFSPILDTHLCNCDLFSLSSWDRLYALSPCDPCDSNIWIVFHFTANIYITADIYWPRAIGAGLKSYKQRDINEKCWQLNLFYKNIKDYRCDLAHVLQVKQSKVFSLCNVMSIKC